MAKEKNPNRIKARELFESSNGGVSIREIAVALGEDERKISVWKQRDKWNVVQQKVQQKNVVQQKVQQNSRERCTTKNKSSGAPLGNKNARGNKGGKGAPLRNQNAVTTGEHTTIWLDMLSVDEQSMIGTMNLDVLAQIDNDIILLTIRERRMMKYLSTLQKQREKPITPEEKSDLADSVTKTVSQQEGKSNKQIIVNRKITERIIAIEDALTRVQAKKISALETKHRILKDIAQASKKHNAVTEQVPQTEAFFEDLGNLTDEELKTLQELCEKAESREAGNDEK